MPRFSKEAAIDDTGYGVGLNKNVWLLEQDGSRQRDSNGKPIKLGEWKVVRDVVSETLALDPNQFPEPMYRLQYRRNPYNESALYGTKEEAERALHDFREDLNMYEGGHLKPHVKEMAKKSAKEAIAREAARLKGC